MGGPKVHFGQSPRKCCRVQDYAVCCVEVSGLACVHLDNDIPLKYGIDQCIGDTLGPGGLFKGLRTVPVFLDILRDIRELAPQAIMLNYTNPMSMLVLVRRSAVPEDAGCRAVSQRAGAKVMFDAEREFQAGV